jgi:hypothetical protein
MFVQFALASQLCAALVKRFVQYAETNASGVALTSPELFPSPPAFTAETA